MILRATNRLLGARHLCALAPQAVKTKKEHTPVMLNETMDALQIYPGEVYIDMTFGAGGHSRALLERGARVAAIDRDPSVQRFADEMKDEFGDNFCFNVAKFTEIGDVLTSNGLHIGSISGVLIDCGCSSMQMDQPRGFSISKNAPLDMRMNPMEKDAPPAAALVNTLDADTLARIFKAYGDEKYHKKIAQAIVDYRYQMKKIRTTKDLSDIVDSAFHEDYVRKDSLGRFSSTATKVFMSLRIFVNDELNQLNRGLALVHQILKPKGRAAVISFHSLEDRIVKRHFSDIPMEELSSNSISQKYRNAVNYDRQEQLEEDRRWQPINPRFILPTESEIERNPRSRSAKLRVAEKRPKF